MSMQHAEIFRENFFRENFYRENYYDEKSFSGKNDFPAQELNLLLHRAFINSPFYGEKLKKAGFKPGVSLDYECFFRLPFTEKHELRQAEPLAHLAVPEEQVVRIHSSSGTTGKPVVIPYTKKDVDDWSEMMARSLQTAGVSVKDRVHITPGYGLWTAGIGFQAGVEKLGAMAVPIGPGNTDKQLELMIDLKSSVLIGTSSYGLLLAEEIAKRNLQRSICLKKGIFGSERWGEKMRGRIKEILAIEVYDIYGLTEVYGPGIAIDCPYHQGMHYWSDYLFMEVIDPLTEMPLPPGEVGELVITTISKEAMPLIRYRTRDLTRLVPGCCPCGSSHPRIDRIVGRSDDMIKIKGVNIYPGQIDTALMQAPGLSSEYQIVLTRHEGRDHMLIKVEKDPGADGAGLDKKVEETIKNSIGVTVSAEVVEYGSLPRSEKKTKRVFDLREM
ncbi:MAG: phenylacetate--CoA ligase [Bacillota bacterium]